MKTLVKVYKTGTKEYEETVACDRCGGDGIYKWGAVINGRPQYAGTCFKCGGSGKMIIRTKEYTPEHEAELQMKREKAAAKKAEEIAAKVAEIQAKEAEEERLLAEKMKAYEDAKKISQYQGEVGKRITVRIVTHKEFDFESDFGYMTIYTMKDAAGNVYVWKTGSALGYDVPYTTENGNTYYDFHGIAEDEEFTLTGTVKAHSEYKGEKQTVLIRCKAKA